tara:strand:- start:3499 stop:3924 length:426 start_codon:yes stop_codon:yes gene_type:complete
MKKIKKYWFEIVIVFMLIVALIGTAHSQEYNINTIKKELIKQDVKHPDIVLKQIILETGWLNCTNCALDANNLFGFWWKKAYKKFDNWKDGVSYYKVWQEKWYITGDYYAFLECIYVGSKGDCKRYATDPLYTTKLKQIRI